MTSLRLVLLVGRVPRVERTLGQDRLTRLDRVLAPWALVLIAAHGALTAAGYAQAARTGALPQFGVPIGSYPGAFAAASPTAEAAQRERRTHAG